MPLAIDGPVERPWPVFVHLAWDGAPYAMSPQILPHLAAARRLVTYAAPGAGVGATTPAPLHRPLRPQVREECRFMALAGRQDQRQQRAIACCSQMCFGTEATLAAA